MLSLFAAYGGPSGWHSVQGWRGSAGCGNDSRMTSRNEIPLFSAHGLADFRLTEKDAPDLQRLLERCHDYFEMVEGRRPKGDAALRELRTTPPGVPIENPIPLGQFSAKDAMAGTILVLSHYRRETIGM